MKIFLLALLLYNPLFSTRLGNITSFNKQNDAFLNIPLKMQIHSNQKFISTESKKGIGLGSPLMRSLYDQSITYDNTGFEQLYQFTLDFSEIPRTIKKIDRAIKR